MTDKGERCPKCWGDGNHVEYVGDGPHGGTERWVSQCPACKGTGRMDERRGMAVDWFAVQMKAKLSEPRNVAKGLWDECPDVFLLHRLRMELRELEVRMAEYTDPEQSQEIIREAADVANFAMMIADNAYRRAHD